MSDPEHDSEASAEVFEPELPPEADDLPPIDFSTFIVSLRTSAMLHLGANPEGSGIDLALARQEIDLLGILEEKTKGNLTGDEERLLSQILFDLRTRYLSAVAERRSTKSSG
ncbi:MAG: DUF1844 domain-containing protein [Myxococcales bacterium]